MLPLHLCHEQDMGWTVPLSVQSCPRELPNSVTQDQHLSNVGSVLAVTHVFCGACAGSYSCVCWFRASPNTPSSEFEQSRDAF